MITALVVAVMYGLGCVLFGERFPFSRFQLYSSTANRTMSAVAVFLVDNEPAPIWEYHRFSGFVSGEFLDPEYPTAVQWVSLEAARWVDEHTDDGPPGPVSAGFGYRVFSFDDNGVLQERIDVLQEGHAWKI